MWFSSVVSWVLSNYHERDELLPDKGNFSFQSHPCSWGHLSDDFNVALLGFISDSSVNLGLPVQIIEKDKIPLPQQNQFYLAFNFM